MVPETHEARSPGRATSAHAAAHAALPRAVSTSGVATEIATHRVGTARCVSASGNVVCVQPATSRAPGARRAAGARRRRTLAV